MRLEAEQPSGLEVTVGLPRFRRRLVEPPPGVPPEVSRWSAKATLTAERQDVQRRK